MRLDLLGYLTGALDGPEQDRTKQALQHDPQLQSQLDELEERLATLYARRDKEEELE